MMKVNHTPKVYEQLTDDNFGQAVETEEAVMVMFEGPWCGSCHIMEPILRNLGESYSSKVRTYRVNVEESRDTADQYGINELPTLIFFRGGLVVDHIYGAVPKKVIEDKLVSLFMVTELKN